MKVKDSASLVQSSDAKDTFNSRLSDSIDGALKQNES